MNTEFVADALLILSENLTKELILKGNGETINSFYEDFFQIIAVRIEGNEVILDSPFIQITDKMKDKIAKLTDSWKNIDVHIFQLKKFFDNIPSGHYISVLPKHNLTDELNVYLVGALRRLNSGSSIDEVLHNPADVVGFKSLFSNVLSKYSAECNTAYVGEHDKTKRVCRFCGKSMPEVTFKKVAHAIPDGLGNKTVFDNEECDDCNLRFGNGLDNELIDYFSFYRGIFGIRGKEGIVKNKFKNGYITEDENGILVASQDITVGEVGKPESVEFLGEKKLIPQNIYKALARVSLGTVKNFDINTFKKAVDWINTLDSFYDKLPKIAFMSDPAMYTYQPNVINYTLRFDDDLPFLVSELHLKFLVLVYIVPVKDNDFSFVVPKKYKQFWTTFKHYSQINSWKFLDFSSQKPEQIKYKMNLIER